MLLLKSKIIFLRNKIRSVKYALNERYFTNSNKQPARELTQRNHSDNYSSLNSFTNDLIDKDLKIYENFVSEIEEENLMAEIEPSFKRKRYQFDHWDGAIQGYRETEKEQWNDENSQVIQRLRKFAFPMETVPLKHTHVLDLSKTGHIKPHIDSIKFCGNIIAGISLLSTSVMRLVMEEDKNIFIDVLLKRKSLYIIRDSLRFKFTHEIFADEDSFFKARHKNLSSWQGYQLQCNSVIAKFKGPQYFPRYKRVSL